MKNLIKFLLFIFYSTSIFFFPNNKFILIFVIINIIFLIINNKHFKKIIKNILNIIPFIIFTFIINCLLDTYINAIWISIKLILVTIITVIYASTIRVTEFADTISELLSPLKKFNVNPDEIKILICISLSMIPILKSDIRELREACIAKKMKFNIKNVKFILSKFLLSIIMKVNNIEEVLISKGYSKIEY